MSEIKAMDPNGWGTRSRSFFAVVFRHGVVWTTVLALGLALAAGTGCRKETPDQRLQDIQTLFNQRKIVDAVLKSKELIRDYPDDPASYQARMTLAHYYYTTGDAERSHEYLEQIYKGLGLKDLRGIQALMQDAQIYSVQQEYKKGLDLIDHALKTLPNDAPSTPDLFLQKAALLIQTKEPEKGEALFHHLMLHAGQKVYRDQARELLGQYYRQKEEWQKEFDVYADFEKAYPNTELRPHFDIVQGIALQKLGKTKQGDALYEKGIDALKKEAEGELEQTKATSDWITVARYQLAAERPEDAVKTLDHLREKYPKSPDATQAGVMIGEIRLRQKRYADAIEEFKKVRAENPLGQVADFVNAKIQQVHQIEQQEKATTSTLAVRGVATSSTPELAPKATEGAPKSTPKPASGK